MKKLSKNTFTLVLAAALFILTVVPPINSNPTTTVYLSPKENYPSVDQAFTVNVNIEDVVDLHFWQLLIRFDPELLECLDLWVPPDNIFGSLAELPPPEIDNSAGYVKVGCWRNSLTGVSGSGTLCQIEFNCIDPGLSPIIIVVDEEVPQGASYLADPFEELIQFEALSGSAEIQAPGFHEDVFYVTQDSVTYPVIVFSNSTVDSFGFSSTDKEMTFDVSGESGTPGSSSVVFSKALMNGTFAVLVQGEPVYFSLFKNNTHNFMRLRYEHSNKTIRIRLTITGDINGDRRVNIKDIYIIILAFGSEPGDQNWNPLANIAPLGDPDNRINMMDVYLAILHFGEEWS